MSAPAGAPTAVLSMPEACSTSGWLAAAVIWWQGAQTRSQLTDQMTAAEKARESLAADLQNLEKKAGSAADLKNKAAAAEKALSDAAAAQFSEQELAGLVVWIATTNLYNRINVTTRQVPGTW